MAGRAALAGPVLDRCTGEFRCPCGCATPGILEYLCLMSGFNPSAAAAAADSERWPAFWRWAGIHPSLRCLGIELKWVSSDSPAPTFLVSLMDGVDLQPRTARAPHGARRGPRLLGRGAHFERHPRIDCPWPVMIACNTFSRTHPSLRATCGGSSGAACACGAASGHSSTDAKVLHMLPHCSCAPSINTSLPR